MVSSKSTVLSYILLTATALGAVAAEKDFSYMPDFHGVLRTRWEMDTRSGAQRFQVRNARVSMAGRIAPSVDYFFQTDLCDAGKMKILDAWGRFRIVRGLTVQAGQFRMPFGVEPFRAPANYIFANRSFIGKQVMNYRAVGAKVAYTLPRTPLTLEAGVFNPTSIGDHNVWSKTAAWSAKALWRLPAGFAISAGYASIQPAQTRANLIDGCLTWENSHLLIAGEYMYKHYCCNAHKEAHSYAAFIDWHIPVKAGIFNQWSLQGRVDGMTDHFELATGKKDTFNPERHRATIGTTLTYRYKALHADIRLNYENYFDGKGCAATTDRFVTELVVRF